MHSELLCGCFRLSKLVLSLCSLHKQPSLYICINGEEKAERMSISQSAVWPWFTCYVTLSKHEQLLAFKSSNLLLSHP